MREPDIPEEAEIEATLTAHDEWVAAGRPGAMTHEEVVADLLGRPLSPEELDTLEETGRTADMPEEEARRILGIPADQRDERHVTGEEARHRLGLPRADTPEAEGR